MHTQTAQGVVKSHEEVAPEPFKPLSRMKATGNFLLILVASNMLY